MIELALAVVMEWSMVVGGDLLLSGVPVRDALFVGLPEIAEADAAYANLETPLTAGGKRTTRKSAADIASGRQFILKGDPEYVQALAAAGFDLLSLGNNHMSDYGAHGILSTLECVKEAGMVTTGAGSNLGIAMAPAYFETDYGVRIAMLSFLSFVGHESNWACAPATKGRFGVAALDFGGSVTAAHRAEISRIVASCDRADFVVVALHWGIQGHSLPRAYQVELGRAFIDAGADFVVGTHPHVLQGAEIYKGKPILYSMGDLARTGARSSSLLRVWFGFDGRFLRAEEIPVSIAGGVTQQSSAAGRMASLCRRLAAAYPHPEARPLEVE